MEVKIIVKSGEWYKWNKNKVIKFNICKVFRWMKFFFIVFFWLGESMTRKCIIRKDAGTSNV